MKTDNKTWESACYENRRNAIILRAINDVLESEDEALRMNILDSKQECFSSVKKKNAIKFLKSEWFTLPDMLEWICSILRDCTGKEKDNL